MRAMPAKTPPTMTPVLDFFLETAEGDSVRELDESMLVLVVSAGFFSLGAPEELDIDDFGSKLSTIGPLERMVGVLVEEEDVVVVVDEEMITGGTGAGSGSGIEA